MVRYLVPVAPPVPIIPLNSKAYRKNAIFAKRGLMADDSYDYDVLKVGEGVDVRRGAGAPPTTSSPLTVLALISPAPGSCRSMWMSSRS